jgi:hypothetical protein
MSKSKKIKEKENKNNITSPMTAENRKSSKD